jgi:hemerythrin-like domain-containing protein
MKRHPGLRDLSVDHHHALVQAHRLQAADTDAPTQQATFDGFVSFWREHTGPHFREEEEALLPFFARYGDVDAEPIRQMQREHILIRRDVAALLAMSTADARTRNSAMQALGRQLEAHVRLEERVVFPLIEAALPEQALSQLPAALSAWRREAGLAPHTE